MKLALCIGINDYNWLSPESCLHGCITDARDWGELFLDCYGFNEVHYLLDGAATPQAVRSALSLMAEKVVPGDTVAITYSGHGTRVPDKNGDEADGYDEAIVLHGSWYTDDEIDGDLKMLKAAKVVVVADSCHSGTVLRGLMGLMGERVPSPHPPIPRYVDMLARGPNPPPRNVLHHRFGKPRAMEPNRILLAGCKDVETSADAWLAGAYHGALTYHATRLLRERPWMTWKELIVTLRQIIKRTSPQTPQLEGVPSALDGVVFS